MRTVISPLQEWGQVVCAVYSVLSITIGLLFDMYVLSGLISTFVCSLRSKGQGIEKETLDLALRLYIKRSICL